MFRVSQEYKLSRSTDCFETYEEALADAEEKASKDYEEYTFLVSEVKAVVKAEPLALPIKTAVVTKENSAELLLEANKNES